MIYTLKLSYIHILRNHILGSKVTKFNGTIKCLKSSKAQSFAKSKGYKYSAYTLGDVNNDGNFDAADLVALNKYILIGNIIANWRAGDFDKNERLNIYDVCLMRKAYIAENCKATS